MTRAKPKSLADCDTKELIERLSTTLRKFGWRNMEEGVFGYKIAKDAPEKSVSAFTVEQFDPISSSIIFDIIFYDFPLYAEVLTSRHYDKFVAARDKVVRALGAANKDRRSFIIYFLQLCGERPTDGERTIDLGCGEIRKVTHPNVLAKEIIEDRN